MGVVPNPLKPDDRAVVWWAWATLVANIGIVLTGGLVRLTASGLGCPTWPRCTEESFVPHGELGLHGVIEFGNRMLTYVLIAVVVATYVAIRRWSRTTTLARRLALAIAIGIPFQGVIGGITVLTDLNPWIVSLHLILSMVLIALSTRLLLLVRGDQAGSPAPWQVAVYGVTWVAVYLGTVVTGAGPHAGDLEAPRNGLDPQVWSHVHAASVYVLIALTAAVAWWFRGTAAGRAAIVLLVVELAQGTIGLVQYFTDLPIALVAMHLVGAGVLVAFATRLLLSPRESTRAARPRRPRQSAGA